MQHSRTIAVSAFLAVCFLGCQVQAMPYRRPTSYGDGVADVTCFCWQTPCTVSTPQACPNYPYAVCQPDLCGDCKSRYFYGGSEVTKSCKKGQLQQAGFTEHQYVSQPLAVPNDYQQPPPPPPPPAGARPFPRPGEMTTNSDGYVYNGYTGYAVESNKLGPPGDTPQPDSLNERPYGK